MSTKIFNDSGCYLYSNCSPQEYFVVSDSSYDYLGEAMGKYLKVTGIEKYLKHTEIPQCTGIPPKGNVNKFEKKKS